jgi:hypothetical protein
VFVLDWLEFGEVARLACKKGARRKVGSQTDEHKTKEEGINAF